MDPDFVDEERIPLMEEDDDDSLYEDVDEGQTETPFMEIPTEPGPDIQAEATREKMRRIEKNIEDMDLKINALERNFGVKIPREQRSRFRLNNGYLQIDNEGKYENLTKLNGELLAASTLHGRLGASLARGLLGIETPQAVKTESRLLLDTVPTENEIEELAPDKIEEGIEETTREIGVNTDLDMREFLGIDKALTRIKGELENNASKLTELDVELKRNKDKLAEVENDEVTSESVKQRIRDRIVSLNKERKAKLEILSQNKKELASQFARIRKTVEKILNEDLTLREKIKLVFREHGLTITAVLTSLGLAISTLIGFLTGGGGSSGGTPPKQPNRLKEWVKGKLKALARLLGRLADKLAAALPDIIGWTAAQFFNFLKNVVVAASHHVWLFITSIATLVAYRVLYPPAKKHFKDTR